MKNITKIDLKVLGFPVLGLFCLLVLGFIAGRSFLTSFNKLNSEMRDNTQKETELSQKLSSLKILTNAQTGNQLKVLSLDFPQNNPTFEVISKIRSLGDLAQVKVGSFTSSNVGGDKNSGIFSSEIKFEAEGTYPALAGFIPKLRAFFPITVFNDIKIVGQALDKNSPYKLSGSVLTYWGEFPKMLPSIDAPLTELTSDEQSELNKVLSLQAVGSASASIATPSGAMGKTNPFQ